MKMKKKVTNFVLNKLQRIHPLFRTNEEGSTIRNSRLKKFRRKGKKLVIAAQIVAIWYLLILSGSYLTTNTGAYFNDVEKISGSIKVSDNYCEDVKNGTPFWHKYCKDNSGLGNGPDTPDVNTGEGTDPDNPGHNKDGCDDHTNAPCTRITNLKETNTSNSITLTWSNPNKDFDFAKVYRNGNLVGENIKNEQFIDENLLSSTKYSYKISIVDNSGNESPGLTIDVTTRNDEVDKKLPENVKKLIGNRNGNSHNINLTWKNPTGISYVRIYVEGNPNPIKDLYKEENINLTSKSEVTYRVTTVDSLGNESLGETITIK
jgi:predicted ribosomally synthesized peptide with SipW-like signal peptide